MGSFKAVIDDDALEFISEMANGDARTALNAIELGVLTTDRAEDGLIHIDLDTASECIQKRVLKYDKAGDNHYDTISAFIKSMRGSDPDAAIYYLARMLAAGEDIKFIARRMMISASEDVGNANPMAICVATSVASAVAAAPAFPDPPHPAKSRNAIDVANIILTILFSIAALLFLLKYTKTAINIIYMYIY